VRVRSRIVRSAHGCGLMWSYEWIDPEPIWTRKELEAQGVTFVEELLVTPGFEQM